MRAIKDSAIYLAGELISRSMPFLLLPYLSRKLGVEGFGELAYYQTYLALFLMIVSLSQEGAVARYFYVYGKRSLNLVINAGYAYTLITGSLILIGCWIAQSEILAYLALTAMFQSFVAVQLTVRQSRKQPISYMVIQFLSSFSSVVFTVLLLEIFSEALIEKRFLALLFANIFALIIAYYLYLRSTRIRTFIWKSYKTAILYVLGFGLPLILHNASLFLKGQIDRVFIYHQFSQYELGLYAMGVQIASILMIILYALNKALVPYLFEGLKRQRITLKQIHKWTLYALCLVPIPALIMALIPESLVVWVLGKQFVGTKYYIILFLISSSLSMPYFLLVNYLFYYGKNQFVSLCSILSTIVYLVSLILLTLTKIEYVPFASILGATVILPILYFVTLSVDKKRSLESGT